MIYLEINGTRYTNFLDLNVERSIENITGTFNFTATYASDQSFPIKRRDPCRILVNETAILTGYVEVIEVNYGSDQHTVRCSGRDNTADIFDSQLDGDIEFKPPVTLTTVINTVVNKLGIKNMSVVNEAGTIEAFQQKDLVSARVGQTAFNFIENYSRKRQVFVTSDGQGNIVLARGSTQTISLGGLYNQIGDPTKRNNILNSSIKFDDTNRFNTYKCKSQLNPVAITYSIDTVVENQQVVNQEQVATDPAIRSTRVLVFNAESSSDGVDVANRATWEANIRRVRSFTYKATVQGDSYNGVNPWRVNRLVQVIDDFANINAVLLIKSLSFSLSVNGGTTTSIECVTPDGYTPQAKLPKNKEKTNNLGDNFVYKIED